MKYRYFLYAVSSVILFSHAGYGDETNSAPDQAISCAWISELQAQLDKMGLTLDPDQATQATVLALVKTVDSHARLIDEAEWTKIQEQRAGTFYLPGFSLGITNGLPVVTAITADPPAETNSLTRGDVITGIGTQLFTKISLPHAQQLFESDKMEELPVRYIRANNTNESTVTLAALKQAPVELSEKFPNNVGYIKINGMYPGSGRDIVTRIRSFSETERDGIILDLRGAGGSDDESAAQTASLFCRDSQFMFAYRDHHHQDLSVFNSQNGAAISIPVMVLIDRYTSGSSETLAAALNGSAREVLLVGEKTAGDFNIREAVNLSSQLVYMTTRVLDTADGIRYKGQTGIEPAVVINGNSLNTHDYEPPEDLMDRRIKLDVEERDLATRRRVRGDGVLERAIDILIGLKSLNKASGAVSSPELL